MRTPRAKFPATPTASRTPSSARASAPAGVPSTSWRARSAAATRSAIPMPRRTRRRLHPATALAPSQAPTTAAAIMSTSVRGSTSTMAMKTSACTTDGSAWPTLSVPGSRRSGTRWKARKSAVVGANDPTPSVSKKFVTAPMARLFVSTPASGARTACARRRQAIHHPAKPPATTTSSPSSTSRASVIAASGPRLALGLPDREDDALGEPLEDDPHGEPEAHLLGPAAHHVTHETRPLGQLDHDEDEREEVAKRRQEGLVADDPRVDRAAAARRKPFEPPPALPVHRLRRPVHDAGRHLPLLHEPPFARTVPERPHHRIVDVGQRVVGVERLQLVDELGHLIPPSARARSSPRPTPRSPAPPCTRAPGRSTCRGSGAPPRGSG